MTSHTVPIMEPIPDSTAPATTQVSTDPSLEAVTVSMKETTLSPSTPDRPIRRTTSVKLSVPLDGNSPTTTTTRKLVRRDSLERREALLKGKEGSRQRRRWENDRLLNNPWAEPPLPSDWEVRPTYPVRRIPYYLAPLWDAAEFQRAVESKLKGRRNTMSKKNKNRHKPNAAQVYGAGMSPFEEAASSIPKEVRSRLKHARSAKGLLQDLEEEVRGFVKSWNEREIRLREEGLHDVPLPLAAAGSDTEEEDDEIVFVGRNGAMHDSPSRKQRQEDENLLTEKLIFEGLEGDKGASFGRWLTHCIGSYYGLRTWSVTTDGEGTEERKRQAYVGVDARVRGWMGKSAELGREVELPRPLWGMV